MANEEKVAKFHQAINHYAMEQREKIEQEVAAFKKKELEEASNEVLAEAYHLIQKEMAQMRGRISREMARREMDGRRALLEKRSRIAEKVFAQAADILRKETESDRYSALLTRYAKAAHDAFARRSEDAGLPFPEDVVFLLNKKDQAFQETIRKAYGAPCVFREDSSISIGGFCAESPSLRLEIDSTLDSMLENQRDWFEEASQLSVG